jgi:hypothetical protein
MHNGSCYVTAEHQHAILLYITISFVVITTQSQCFITLSPYGLLLSIVVVLMDSKGVSKMFTVDENAAGAAVLIFVTILGLAVVDN